MILVWFERSQWDEFDSGDNFQFEKKNSFRNLEPQMVKTLILRRSAQNLPEFLENGQIPDYSPHIMSDRR